MTVIRGLLERGLSLASSSGWVAVLLLNAGCGVTVPDGEDAATAAAQASDGGSREVLLGPDLLSTPRQILEAAVEQERAIHSPLEPLTEEPRAIAGGGDDVSTSPVSQRRRDATVRIVFSGGAVCSGTLITPRLILTAGHCAAAYYAWEEPRSPLSVSFGANASSFSTVAPIGCFRHPDYGGGPVAGNQSPPGMPQFAPCGSHVVSGAEHKAVNDLMLIALPERLDSGRSGSVAVTPAPPGFEVPSIGDSVRLSGWGLLGTGAAPTVRQTVDDTLDGRGNSTYPADGWFGCNDPVAASTASGFNVVAMDSLIFRPHVSRGGDSGGGVTVGDPDSGELTTIGVISGGELYSQPVFCHGVPIGEQNIVNASWAAPLSMVRNAAWIRGFLEAPVLNPPAEWELPIYLGDWDLPLRGEHDRGEPEFAVLRTRDRDGDGLIDEHDNCPTVFNPEQRDGASAAVDVPLDGVADFADCLLVPTMEAMF